MQPEWLSVFLGRGWIDLLGRIVSVLILPLELITLSLRAQIPTLQVSVSTIRPIPGKVIGPIALQAVAG